MNVLIDMHEESAFADDGRIQSLCDFFASRQRLPAETEVSILFTDDEEMRSLNREYRGIDRTTDVLSFECDGVDDGFPSAGIHCEVLGDIVISPKVAETQAPEHGNTPEQEIDLLIIHGLLHLCGYDHVAEEDAAIMEPLQDRLVDEWRRTGEFA